MLQAPEDRKVYGKFIADYTTALKRTAWSSFSSPSDSRRTPGESTAAMPSKKTSLPRPLGTIREYRIQHPEIHAAMVQALRFIDNPKLFTWLSLYEAESRRTFRAT